VSHQFHARATLPPRKRTRFPLDRRLGGPQRRSGHGGKEKQLLHVPRIETPSSSL